MTVLGLGSGGYHNNPAVQSVMEAYVGRNRKEFAMIEKELKAMIQMIRDQSQGRVLDINPSKLNSSDHMRAIERQFKNLFDVKEVSISWRGGSNPDAHTYCKTFMILDKNYKKDAAGHKTNKNLFVNTTLGTGLVLSCNLNEKELLAIILHEIGHNFYNHLPVIMTLALLNDPFSLLYLGVRDLLGGNKFAHNLNAGVRNFFSEKIPSVYKAFNTISHYSYNLGTMVPAFNVLTFIPQLPKIMMNVLSPNYWYTYQNEKYADSFATRYGYGVELGSALSKLERQEGTGGASFKESVPVASLFYDFFDVQVTIISGLITGYPSTQDRLRSILDRLRYELAHSDDLSPALRKELQAQVNEYEAFYADYLKVDDGGQKFEVFSNAYRSVVEKVFAGKADIRQIFVRLDPKFNE